MVGLQIAVGRIRQSRSIDSRSGALRESDIESSITFVAFRSPADGDVVRNGTKAHGEIEIAAVVGCCMRDDLNIFFDHFAVAYIPSVGEAEDGRILAGFLSCSHFSKRARMPLIVQRS